MRTIVCVHPLESQQVEQIKEVAPDWQIISGKLNELDEAIIREAEILLSWNNKLSEIVFHPEAKLRWIQVWSAGIDTMPLQELEQKSILLTDGSGVHPHSMSETALAMMLAFTRNIHQFVRNQSQQIWNRDMPLVEMHGKTAAIIGVGEIGIELARMCKAFGMHVLGLRRSGVPTDHVDHMYTMDHLHHVLTQSDYVINILPHTEETTHLFNQEAFAHMKASAYYINIGRGQTTDEAALTQALLHQKIAGAGLDVMEQEPLPPEDPLWQMDNVIITPHIGGVNEHYHERIMAIFIDNLQAYIHNGVPSRNLVDYRLGY